MLPYDMITKDHLKDVLAGKKKLLKIKDVNFCNPPAFDEIGVKNLFEKVMRMPEVKIFFPEIWPKGRQCDKSYFYNVWNTIHEDQVQNVIKHANSVRYSLMSDEVKDNSIIITKEWQDELESMPFTSKIKGKMSALLKQKSKINAKPKDRVQYEAYEFG